MAKKNHPSNYKVVHYNLYWIAQIHELAMDNLSIYKEPMICIICATTNAPNSCTMWEIRIEVLLLRA